MCNVGENSKENSSKPPKNLLSKQPRGGKPRAKPITFSSAVVEQFKCCRGRSTPEMTKKPPSRRTIAPFFQPGQPQKVLCCQRTPSPPDPLICKKTPLASLHVHSTKCQRTADHTSKYCLLLTAV